MVLKSDHLANPRFDKKPSAQAQLSFKPPQRARGAERAAAAESSGCFRTVKSWFLRRWAAGWERGREFFLKRLKRADAV